MGKNKEKIMVYTTSYVLQGDKKKHEQEHEIGLALLRKGLKELYGISLGEEELTANLSAGLHGKPYLKNREDIHFNISHCEGMIVCAFSDEPVGVDVEQVRKIRDSLPKRVLTEKEQEFLKQYKENEPLYYEFFFRFWTLKESYIKWDGSGLFKEPNSISFELDGNVNPVKITSSVEGLHFHQQFIKDKYILALCTTEQSEYSLIQK